MDTLFFLQVEFNDLPAGGGDKHTIIVIILEHLPGGLPSADRRGGGQQN